MKKMIQKFILFVLIFNASILFADCCLSYETEIEVKSCKKIYVLPDQLAITAHGIFIMFDDNWHETNAIFSDANGIFIRPQETNRRGCEEGYQRCRNCRECVREVYDICPLCNRPARM